jgi:hypothetical protein
LNSVAQTLPQALGLMPKGVRLGCAAERNLRFLYIGQKRFQRPLVNRMPSRHPCECIIPQRRRLQLIQDFDVWQRGQAACAIV